MYIYEQSDWPHFIWDFEKVSLALTRVIHQQGRLRGGMESIGFHSSEDAFVQTLTQDVIKSSEIEGEILDSDLVRSSVARHLGIEDASLNPVDRNIEGIVEMTLDATQNFEESMTEERFWKWHVLLFPDGRSGWSKIKVGKWRTGPVQVVSGRAGRETVHFEGPPFNQVDQMMNQLIVWINQENDIDLVLKAAIAHLWFVTIHPFDDGNGRIGRAIADMLLARSEQNPRRFYSLSAQIQSERKQYYAILEKTQKGELDITPWIMWFLSCLERSITHSLTVLEKVVHKTHFWDTHEGLSLNERQRKVINLLLEGFQGKLTTSKWAKITKSSQDTAYRDITDLIDQGILIKNPEGGRSTSYSFVASIIVDAN